MTKQTYTPLIAVVLLVGCSAPVADNASAPAPSPTATPSIAATPAPVANPEKVTADFIAAQQKTCGDPTNAVKLEWRIDGQTVTVKWSGDALKANPKLVESTTCIARSFGIVKADQAAGTISFPVSNLTNGRPAAPSI